MTRDVTLPEYLEILSGVAAEFGAVSGADVTSSPCWESTLGDISVCTGLAPDPENPHTLKPKAVFGRTSKLSCTPQEALVRITDQTETIHRCLRALCRVSDLRVLSAEDQ